QEDVGRLQSIGLGLAQDAGTALPMQSGEQVALLQRRLATSPDELVELDDEFDLANAAFPQLDVVTRVDPIAGQRPALPVRANAFAQPAQSRQCVEVEIFAVHEGNAQRLDLM